jgi:hypothetical protein
LDTADARLVGYNIVVVLEELRFGAALNELARRLLPGHPSPLITEIPDQLLAVVYPEKQIQCQFANRRVEVRDGRGVDPGADPFATIAIKAIEAASAASAKGTVAYGYNFDVHLPMTGSDPSTFLKDRFLTKPDQIANAFAGVVKLVGIKATIDRQGSLVNFDLEPAGDGIQAIKAHVNYHFEPGEPPVDAGVMESEMRDRYAEFLAALERL